MKYILAFCTLFIYSTSQVWASSEYGTQHSYSMKVPLRTAITAVDLDKDQAPEALIVQGTKGLHVLGKNMDWTFSARTTGAQPAVFSFTQEAPLTIALATLSEKEHTAHIILLDTTGKKYATWNVPAPVIGSLVAQDIDRDGVKELIMLTRHGQLVVLNSRGEPKAGFPQQLVPLSNRKLTRTFPSPTVGELDGIRSNGLEIIVATTEGTIFAFHSTRESLPRYPIQLNTPIRTSPQLGDINRDGKGELLLVTADGTVELRRPNGTSLPGFPFHIRQSVYANPVVYDLDQDGNNEIYIGTFEGQLVGINTQGQMLQGWPQNISHPITASLLLADVNGDTKIDVLAVSQKGSCYAYEAHGKQVEGYPIHTGKSVTHTPAMGDFLGSGHMSWIIPTLEKTLHIVEDKRSIPTAVHAVLPWGVYQGGAAHTGSVSHVRIPSSLQPKPEKKPNPKKASQPRIIRPKTPVLFPAPGPYQPNGQHCGCNSLDTMKHSPGGLILTWFIFVLGIVWKMRN